MPQEAAGAVIGITGDQIAVGIAHLRQAAGGIVAVMDRETVLVGDARPPPRGVVGIGQLASARIGDADQAIRRVVVEGRRAAGVCGPGKVASGIVGKRLDAAVGAMLLRQLADRVVDIVNGLAAAVDRLGDVAQGIVGEQLLTAVWIDDIRQIPRSEESCRIVAVIEILCCEASLVDIAAQPIDRQRVGHVPADSYASIAQQLPKRVDNRLVGNPVFLEVRRRKALLDDVACRVAELGHVAAGVIDKPQLRAVGTNHAVQPSCLVQFDWDRSEGNGPAARQGNVGHRRRLLAIVQRCQFAIGIDELADPAAVVEPHDIGSALHVGESDFAAGVADVEAFGTAVEELRAEPAESVVFVELVRAVGTLDRQQGVAARVERRGVVSVVCHAKRAADVEQVFARGVVGVGRDAADVVGKRFQTSVDVVAQVQRLPVGVAHLGDPPVEVDHVDALAVGILDSEQGLFRAQISRVVEKREYRAIGASVAKVAGEAPLNAPQDLAITGAPEVNSIVTKAGIRTQELKVPVALRGFDKYVAARLLDQANLPIVHPAAAQRSQPIAGGN